MLLTCLQNNQPTSIYDTIKIILALFMVLGLGEWVKRKGKKDESITNCGKTESDENNSTSI